MISKYMILWLLRHMQLFCNLESFWLMLLFQTHHYQPNGPIKTNGCHARFKCKICHQLDMFPNVHYFVLIELLWLWFWGCGRQYVFFKFCPSLKASWQNQLTTHPDLVIQMYAQKIIFKKIPIFYNNAWSWTQKKVQRINKNNNNIFQQNLLPHFLNLFFGFIILPLYNVIYY